MGMVFLSGGASGGVGTILASMLTEAQFQQENGDEWVLADGRSASGTRYNAITSASTIPDLRGMFLRGKNNGRSDGKQDPAGDNALGTYEADQMDDHSHAGGSGNAGGGPGAYYGFDNQLTSTVNSSGVIGANAGDDTRPRNITVNWFIKIN